MLAPPVITSMLVWNTVERYAEYAFDLWDFLTLDSAGAVIILEQALFLPLLPTVV